MNRIKVKKKVKLRDSQKNKVTQTLTKIDKYGIPRIGNKFAPGYHRDKPKGAISLKTRIINDMLSSYYDKKVNGKQLVRDLPAKGSKGIRQYLDYIVALIKGEANNPNAGTNIYNVIYSYRGENGRKGSTKSIPRTLRERRAGASIPSESHSAESS